MAMLETDNMAMPGLLRRESRPEQGRSPALPPTRWCVLGASNPVLFWYGMVWYGMVWYGMVWYGMVWYGMVWYGMVWYGMGAAENRQQAQESERRQTTARRVAGAPGWATR
jgi:hypothetical protein